MGQQVNSSSKVYSPSESKYTFFKLKKQKQKFFILNVCAFLLKTKKSVVLKI